MTDNTSKIHFTNARLLAVQVLYAHVLGGEDLNQLMSRALLGELGGHVLAEEGSREIPVDLPSADAGLMTRIVESYRTHAEAIDEGIRSGLSENIVFDRLDVTFLCILRAGMAELYVNTETDIAVIISEYVDMAGSFYEGAEIRIVNGVLDRFARLIRPAGSSHPAVS